MDNKVREVLVRLIDALIWNDTDRDQEHTHTDNEDDSHTHQILSPRAIEDLELIKAQLL